MATPAAAAANAAASLAPSSTMATTSPGVLLFDAAAIRATLARYDGWWSGGLVALR